MENASDDGDCCIICLKTSNDGHLLSMVAKTADDINILLNKLHNIEIVNAGSDGLQICISCLDTLEKAAKLKDCLQGRKKIFMPTLETVQETKQDPSWLTLPSSAAETPDNQSIRPRCLKIAQSELNSLGNGSSVEQVKERTGVEITQAGPKCYGRRLKVPKKKRIDDEKPVPTPTDEKIEDPLEGLQEKLAEVSDEMMPTEDGDASSSAHSESSAAKDRGEAKIFAETDDIEMLLPTTVLTNDGKLCKSDALDDFMNNNVEEDSKSGLSSKEVAPAGTQHSETVDDLRCHCGFQAVYVKSFNTHQRMKGCNSANLQPQNASSFKPKTSLPDLNSHAGKQLRRHSLPSNLKQQQKRKLSLLLESESESEVEWDSDMNDDDASLDYVANYGDSVEGCSKSRSSMQTRRSRHQGESHFNVKSDQGAISAVGLTAHQLQKIDKKFECDYCSKVFCLKRGLAAHLKVHIDNHQPFSCNLDGCSKSYSTKRTQRKCRDDRYKLKLPGPFACSYEGCQKSYVHKKTLNWHYRSAHSGLRFTSVKHQQQSGCDSTDTAMHASTVLTSTGNEIERADEKQKQPSGCIATNSTTRGEEPQESISNSGTESISFVQPMRSFSTVSEISETTRDSQESFMYCKKDFATSENMLKHKDRKQVCGECNEVFYQTGKLASHMKFHANIRPFRCTFEGCIKSYDAASVLGDHKRKKNHTDDRFKCCCGFQALSQSGLIMHQNKMKCAVGETQKGSSKKQEEDPSSTEQKVRTKAERKLVLPRFGCDVQGCGESFVTTSELNQHALGHSANPERAESLPSTTVKAPPIFECGCGYKTR